MIEDLLTRDEHQAMALTTELWNLLNRIVGHSRSRQADLQELAVHIHAIQNAILAQAAARAFPQQYRLLGETLAVVSVVSPQVRGGT